MMRGRVDGLIVMSPDIDVKTLKENLPSRLPVVLLNCFVNDTAYDSINIDNFGGAYQMVLHLLQHKHTRVAIIKGTEHNHDAMLRLKGYTQALSENKIPHEEELLIPGDFTDSAGYDAAKRILLMKKRPTAIFACNDSMAIGAMSALREMNVDVPAEIAVAGFDDIPMARIVRPKLTTVRVAINELGTLASETLFAAVRDKEKHVRHHRLIPTDIAIRESCGTH
jgi:LacI family transcriptional regulator